MPNTSEAQKKREFNENLEIMNKSQEALTSFMETFSGQTNAENLLATGGSGEFGSIESELASLSVMNEIRIGQRQQVFKEDTVFSANTFLKMRDKAFVEATGEINRRKAIKSHRYDKTRKNRANTANETMNKANEKISTLQKRLKGEDGLNPPTKLQKVSAMEEIYNNIRVADRNFAEALSLNKEEEKKLKNKAELTYRASLKRMYEREMEGLDENSREYIKIKSKYDENLRIYNELMRPIKETKAMAEADEGVIYGEVREDQIEMGPQLEVMDKEAEESVDANVELFEKLNDTLEDAKYGNEFDPLWSNMKAHAFNLIRGWEKNTDAGRGQDLFNVMLAANKYLAKENGINKNRAKAAKEFRNFFKSTLDGMSDNCRILALDEIYKELDRLEEKPECSDALKKQNKSLFTEMAREMLMKKGKLDKDNKFFNEIDDDFYRVQYSMDKAVSKGNNVLKVFGDTKEFAIANMKFDFSRSLGMEMLSDSFRLDRFGRVIPEDKEKANNWGKLISDISKCNTNEALEIQRKWYMRTMSTPVDNAFFSEKVFKKYYEFLDYSTKVVSTQNYGNDWRPMTPREIDNAIKNWNTKHPDNKISEKDVKKINRNELLNQKNNIEKLPLIKEMTKLHMTLDFKGYVNMLKMFKGMEFEGFELKPKPDHVFEDNKNAIKLVKEGKQGVFQFRDADNPFYHQDGTEFENVEAQEVDGGYLVRQNQENPLMLSHEYLQTKAQQTYQEVKPMLNKSENIIKRMEIRQERLNKEKEFMSKIKTLVPEKMKDAAMADYEKLQQLFDEFLGEAQVQILEKETLDEIDVRAEDENKKSLYYIQSNNYEIQKIKMNRLFEKLDEAQSSFIKKYAGEAAYKKWRQGLDKEREESAIREQSNIDEGSTTADRVIRAYIQEENSFLSEGFSEEEVAQIEKNCKDRNIKFLREQVSRVLHPFILNVRRDFTGAPLTEEDRYCADFNKRFKEAVLKHDSNALKELSREFVKITLPKINPLSPKDIDELGIEKLEKDYYNDGHLYSRVTLNLTSCINHKINNTMFPELKVGLDELREKDKKTYDEIMKNCDVDDGPLFVYALICSGYDKEKKKFIPESNMPHLKKMFEILKEDHKNRYSDEKKS